MMAAAYLEHMNEVWFASLEEWVTYNTFSSINFDNICTWIPLTKYLSILQLILQLGWVLNHLNATYHVFVNTTARMSSQPLTMYSSILQLGWVLNHLNTSSTVHFTTLRLSDDAFLQNNQQQHDCDVQIGQNSGTLDQFFFFLFLFFWRAITG